jgi:hypothetical protein
MNINTLTLKSLVATAALIASTTPLLAQHGHAASPHITINRVVDHDSITLVYGSPYTKDPRTGDARKIWGKLIPFGEVWRMGADEATLLTTKEALQIGDTAVPAGTYSLYVLPASDGSAKLIINKQTGQWGTDYDKGQDLARIDLKKETVACPVDHFVMSIEHGASSGGELKLMWEDVGYSLAFTVKK